MRATDAVLESSARIAAFRASSFAFSPSRRSTSMFSRSTATFSATMPARSAATTTIQRTPPATRGRAAGRGRGRDSATGTVRALGRGRGAVRAAAVATSGVRPHGHPEPRRRGADVRGHLGGRRSHGLAGQEAKSRLVPTDADRKVGRAGATARLGGEEPLHDPVFERVEADDGDPSPRPQKLDDRRQGPFERAELVVHRDPECLEHALGGVPGRPRNSPPARLPKASVTIPATTDTGTPNANRRARSRG